MISHKDAKSSVVAFIKGNPDATPEAIAELALALGRNSLPPQPPIIWWKRPYHWAKGITRAQN